MNNITKIELARKGQIIKEFSTVARFERYSVEYIIQGVADGSIVIPKNRFRNVKKIVGIGKGLKTKVNANIGTSPEQISIELESKKLEIAIDAGADTVMDLSIGGDIKKIRRMILKNSSVPVGTVPIYQAACEAVSKYKDILKMTPESMFAAIEEQLEDGVDFITVHCGVTKSVLSILNRQKRLAGIVSRGGSFLAKWITAHDKENPLYEQFDHLLEIAHRYDVTLSLGDGLRPGCIYDASDAAQIAELSVLGELVLRARDKGVQVMIEGPGHMPMDHIQSNVFMAKRLGNNAPLYLLGPLVTDVAAGYDHITGAIGGAIAASYGADFLCYVTPAEHLHLPQLKDVYDGIMASRIAAHAADIVKNVPCARNWDNEFSKLRKNLDWKKQERLALDSFVFHNRRFRYTPKKYDVCTMCGEFCAMREQKDKVK